MAKIKEISIGRSRKYAWDFGNAVGYNINITIEGDESDIIEMKEMAYKELTIMAIKEEERCRNEAGADAELERIKQTQKEPEEKPLPKLPKGTPKIDTGKVYNYKFKNGNDKTCTRCNALVSFDDYNKETHPWPTHVNKEGHIIGDGSCPEYGG